MLWFLLIIPLGLLLWGAYPRPIWVLFTHLNRGDGRELQLELVMREFLKYSPAVLLGIST